MEREPDYAAFLDHFDGFKNYHLIPPEIWAKWNEANRKFESEAAFWSRMEHRARPAGAHRSLWRLPAHLIEETWACWDAVNAALR